MNEEVTTFTQLRMLAERSRAYGTSLAVDITQALMDVAEVAGDAQDAADTAQQGVSDLKEELQNLNDIKDFNLYWCLWSSGTEYPPENDQITYAICGTAVCGLTICGLTEGDFWTTTEPYTVDNLYKWVKIYIELEDGTVKWLGPYCLTDNYTRDLAYELETSITDLQDEINNVVTDTNDAIAQLNNTVDEVAQAVETAQSTADTANQAATAAQTIAQAAQGTAESAQNTASAAQSTAQSATNIANAAQSIAQSANTTATNAQSTANQANTTASNADTTANTALNTASEALSTANSAQTTATEAQTTASSALSAAEEITEKAIVSEAQYFCLWYAGATPPDNGDLTAAICGTAICGLTVCGVTDGILWSTDQPTVVDGLYKWTRQYYTYGDGHTEWGSPYCLTDEYTRQVCDNFQDDLSILQDNIDDAQTMAESAMQAAQVAQETANSISSSSVSAILSSSDWSGSTVPYTQTLTISGLTASQNGILGPGQGLTVAQMTAVAEAILGIQSQSDGSMVIAAYGDKPNVDIPVSVILLG